MALVIMFEPGMRRVERKGEDAAYEACRQIASDIRGHLRPHRKTGALSRSVSARKTKKGGRVYIGTDHWYFIEYGTEPHWITTAKRSLVFTDAHGKKHFLGRSVHHPGTPAFRPIRRAFYKKRSMATLVIADGPDSSVF
jgi:hypothetical protein